VKVAPEKTKSPILSIGAGKMKLAF
jgi:hypothetical protein